LSCPSPDFLSSSLPSFLPCPVSDPHTSRREYAGLRSSPTGDPPYPLGRPFTRLRCSFFALTAPDIINQLSDLCPLPPNFWPWTLRLFCVGRDFGEFFFPIDVAPTSQATCPSQVFFFFLRPQHRPFSDSPRAHASTSVFRAHGLQEMKTAQSAHAYARPRPCYETAFDVDPFEEKFSATFWLRPLRG